MTTVLAACQMLALRDGHADLAACRFQVALVAMLLSPFLHKCGISHVIQDLTNSLCQIVTIVVRWYDVA